jgi:hypothetical protein
VGSVLDFGVSLMCTVVVSNTNKWASSDLHLLLIYLNLIHVKNKVQSITDDEDPEGE